MAARKSALPIEVPPTQPDLSAETTANAGLTLIEGRADRVDPIALAMDQALGLDATRPFTTMSRWNSHAIEFACSLAPVVCDIYSLAVKACVEWQLSWLSWIPGWNLGIAADGSAPENTAEHRRQLAESMDTAIGAQPAQQDSAAPMPYPEAVYGPESDAVEEGELLAKAMAAAS